MLLNDDQYLSVVEDIKSKIQAARYKASVEVNRELILLYYGIGETINAHKSWGNKFIDNLSKDIALAYPDAKGYSVRNLKYMAKFAAEFSDVEFVQRCVAQLPWRHIIALLDKVHDYNIKCWYVKNCIEYGCTRDVLVHQIESKLYERQAIAEKVSNFERTLPAPQSELAAQTMKDPYIFDFVPFKNAVAERQVENALVKNITSFLLELGTGFAFLGHQYHLVVGGDDFYIDLLFYNIKLRCYIVIELKNGEFRPEHAGQLNFYVSAVDGELKQPGDNPTIGLLLCKSKNDLVAEYALRDINKPMGISEYRLGDLPEKYKDLLPSIEDIRKRIK